MDHSLSMSRTGNKTLYTKDINTMIKSLLGFGMSSKNMIKRN